MLIRNRVIWQAYWSFVRRGFNEAIIPLGLFLTQQLEEHGTLFVILFCRQ